jgi:5-methylcytosine-specific restriction protein A
MPYKDPEKRRIMARVYTRKYYHAHKDLCNALTMACHKRNWGKKLEAATRYRESHREQVRESWRKTYYKDPQKRIFYRQNRKARELGNGGVCTLEQWQARCEYYGWRCVYCLKELDTNTVSIDHVIPLVAGGTGWPSNLVPSCKSCNSKKGPVESSLSTFNRRLHKENK